MSLWKPEIRYNPSESIPATTAREESVNIWRSWKYTEQLSLWQLQKQSGCSHCSCKAFSRLMTNSHRRRRRDETVGFGRVGAVNWVGDSFQLCSQWGEVGRWPHGTQKVDIYMLGRDGVYDFFITFLLFHCSDCSRFRQTVAGHFNSQRPTRQKSTVSSSRRPQCELGINHAMVHIIFVLNIHCVRIHT